MYASSTMCYHNYTKLLQAEEHLRRGEILDECFVAELIKERLSSPRIEHYGMCSYTYMCKCMIGMSQSETHMNPYMTVLMYVCMYMYVYNMYMYMYSVQGWGIKRYIMIYGDKIIYRILNFDP